MRNKQYKDPVYGYIELEESLFVNFIDTPEFQRLQRIRQTGYIPLYASATHNRFVHSIGVYFLGRYAFSSFRRNALEDAGDSVAGLDWDSLEKVFLQACLLHDVGHAPFSHTGEEFFLGATSSVQEDLCSLVGDEAFEQDSKNRTKSAAPHEIMSAIVGLKAYSQHFANTFERDFFARCITGYEYGASVESKAKQGVCNAIISLLNSSTIDVDKLDYLIRDAFVIGYRSTAIDYERLLGGLSLCCYHDDAGNTRYELVYKKSAISVLENAVYARDSMKKWIQSHPVIVYEDMLVRNMMIAVDEKLSGVGDTLYCEKALSLEGCDFGNNRVRLLCDGDVIYLAKQIAGNACVDWYLNRGLRHKPFWKSEAEFKAVFKPSLSLGHYAQLVSTFESLKKHLGDIGEFPIINDQSIEQMECYIKKIEAEVESIDKMDDFRDTLYQYGRSLDAMKMLQSFMRENHPGVMFEFVLCTSKDFTSGFSLGKFEETKIFIPECEQPCELKDIVVLPNPEGKEGSFFYLYSREKELIDKAGLERRIIAHMQSARNRV